jgi:hypothetical protein
VGFQGGRCVGLITIPPSCADCLEILDAEPSGTLRACPGLYRQSFTFTFYHLRVTLAVKMTDSNCVNLVDTVDIDWSLKCSDIML